MQNIKAIFLTVQLMFMAVWLVSQSQSAENALKWATVVARYIVYLLTARGLQEVCVLAVNTISSQRADFKRLYEENKTSWMTYAAASAVLVTSQQRLLGEDFRLFFAAYLVCLYLQTDQKEQPTINYGTGMACSFFEGYLKHVIPSDGKDDGFVEKIRKWENAENVPKAPKANHRENTADLSLLDNGIQRHRTKGELEQKLVTKDAVYVSLSLSLALFYFEDVLRHVLESDGKEDGFVQRLCKWENKQGVVFPVKRLLLVITRSLHCPPDLSEFNQHNRDDLPQIRPCLDKSLEAVEKHVAGVMNRRYSNTIYVIKWPDNSHPPVYLAAECATPLHTLHGVLQNHQLYRELVGVNTGELVDDFVRQLQNILERSPACRGKCELVFFNEKTEYLPEVLLRKISSLEPRYRDVIDRHRELVTADDEVPLDADPREPQPIFFGES